MIEFTVIRGLFDTRKRALIFDKDFLKFENNDQIKNLFTTIQKNEITEFVTEFILLEALNFTLGENIRFS